MPYNQEACQQHHQTGSTMESTREGKRRRPSITWHSITEAEMQRGGQLWKDMEKIAQKSSALAECVWGSVLLMRQKSLSKCASDLGKEEKWGPVSSLTQHCQNYEAFKQLSWEPFQSRPVQGFKPATMSEDLLAKTPGLLCLQKARTYLGSLPWSTEWWCIQRAVLAAWVNQSITLRTTKINLKTSPF